MVAAALVASAAPAAAADAAPAIGGADQAVLLLYLVAVLAFGLLLGKRATTTSEFFFGGRKFAWWLVGMSCIATTVGSYSFVKYSQAGYEHGLSSSQSYLNDWFLMPLFLFGWLPIIYYARVTSVPEYFERRFNRTARLLATLIILCYLVGYVGYNFYTVGIALKEMAGWNVMAGAAAVAVVAAAYLHFGGQTSVIMTDLFQGVLLLIAGWLLLVLGLDAVGGARAFWAHFPAEFRTAFAGYHRPAKLPGVGVFWQDGVANGVAFYFMNQGILMRFLCARSARDGRRAGVFVVLVLMPLAAVAVSSGGWVSRALVHAGLMEAPAQTSGVFVQVARLLSELHALPGFYGLLMAALIAALMSTADSLINATSAIVVNDLYRPYRRRPAADRHYLEAARLAALATAALGLGMAWLFSISKNPNDLIGVHANFVATVTPPMVVCILLGACWRRFHARAAVATLLGGSLCMALTYATAEVGGTPLNRRLLGALDHGMGAGADGFTRALFGLAAAAVIGVATTLFVRARGSEPPAGLVMASLEAAKRRFKNGRFKEGHGPRRRLALAIRADLDAGTDADDLAAVGCVWLHPVDLARLEAEPEDVVYVSDPRWWLGGLRSAHLRARAAGDLAPGTAALAASLAAESGLAGRPAVTVERYC